MIGQALAKLLARSASVKIATAGGRVSPWVATAFFVEDGLFVLELMIEAKGKTLANLFASPKCAVMLENGDAFALFAQGEARAVVAEQDAERIKAAIAAKTPSAAGLVALPNLVPVRLLVDRWLLTDVSAGWLPAKEMMSPSAELRPASVTH